MLNDDDLAARLCMEFVFVVRIRVEDHRTWPALSATNLKDSLEDVPDLGKVMVVQRMVSSRFQAQDAGVRFGWPFLARMEHHLSRLPRPSNRFPFNLVAVADLHWLMVCKARICGHEPLLAKSGGDPRYAPAINAAIW
jgi:hypothetical protein